MISKITGATLAIAFIAAPAANALAASSQTELYESYALLAQAEPALDAGLNINADTSVDIGSEGAGASVDSGVNVDGDASANTDSDATHTEGGTFQMGRADMDADASVTSSSMVTNDEDLRSYASYEMQQDTNFEKADFSSNAVSVWYKRPSKLFGVIPMDVSVKATADASGNVDFEYPWYSFLLSSDGRTNAEFEESLENQIRTTINAEGSANSTFSSRSQAAVMADISAALRGTL